MTDDVAIRHVVDLAGPPETVWRFLTRPEQLSRWIGIRAELEPRVGGVFRFEIVPGEWCEGRFVEVDAPRRLVVTWGWTTPSFRLPPGTSRVTFELAATATGTRLVLTHDRLPGDLRAIHDDGWTRFLPALVAAVAADSADTNAR